MYLSARTIWLRHLQKPLIEPFMERHIDPVTGFSHGLSSCGYDVRIREDISLRPGDFVLASVLEHIQVPNDLVGFIKDKSSWARLGIALQNTVIEPGWHGFLTLEISNHSWKTIDIYAGSPIAQVMFGMLDQPTDRPYDGKYQNQPPEPVEAKREGG